jgi:lipoprotein-anchoring transpeptidase ErfK/SrfK
MHRFLPVVLLLFAIVAGYNYLPIRREIVYKLGISGDPTTSCCQIPELNDSTGKFDETASQAIFENQVIDYPKTSLAQTLDSPIPTQQVLGTANLLGLAKWIEVDLKEQKLRAWEGNTLIMEFLISSGKWFPTPKGIYYIWLKTKSQRMAGGSKELGTHYNLPNVPYNMFFYQSYAIHGAYWHNNFGQPMSHGCVNTPIAQAQALYDWTGPSTSGGLTWVKASPTNPGTKVIIH